MNSELKISSIGTTVTEVGYESMKEQRIKGIDSEENGHQSYK